MKEKSTLTLILSFAFMHGLTLIFSYFIVAVLNAEEWDDWAILILSAVTGLLHCAVMFIFANAEAYRDRLRVERKQLKKKTPSKGVVAALIFIFPLFAMYAQGMSYEPIFNLYRSLNFQYIGIMTYLEEVHRLFTGIVMLAPVTAAILGYAVG